MLYYFGFGVFYWFLSVFVWLLYGLTSLLICASALNMSTMGRPTKYTKKMLEAAQHYADNWQDYGDPMPMVTALACELKLSRETVFEWSKDPKKKDFSDAVSQIKTEQRRVLQAKGVTGEHNAKISQLLLSVNHRVIERKEVQNVNIEIATDELSDADLEKIINGK